MEIKQTSKILKDIFKERKITIHRFCVDNGFSKSQMYNVVNHGATPGGKLVDDLCDALGVTVSELYSDDISVKELDSDDIEFVRSYSKLSKDQKRRINDYCKGVMSATAVKKEKRLI